MKIAAIFSPFAGNSEKFTEIGKILEQKLQKNELLACGDGFGLSYLPSASEVGYENASGYRELIRNAAGRLVNAGAELLVCVGGDGIASYVAGAVIDEGSSVPILGIAAGTANVGPVISVSMEKLSALDAKHLDYIKLGGIKVQISDAVAGYGFNDVVIGNTVLGTMDGKMVNLSVPSLDLENRKEAVIPSENITTEGFTVRKCGKAVKFNMKKPAQIVISSLERDNFYGRAITGGLCISAFSDLKAAVALLDQVVITSEETDMAVNTFLACEHLLFGAGDVLELSGLSGDGHVVIDGNPFTRATEALVKLEYIPGLITAAILRERECQ